MTGMQYETKRDHAFDELTIHQSGLMLDRHIVIRMQDVQIKDIGPLGSSDQEVAKDEGHQQSEHRLPAHRK